MTDRQRPPEDIFPEDQDREEPTGNTEVVNQELESRIEDWITQDNAENIEVVATLYKYADVNKTNQDKAQVNYYHGAVPSRHEIGLQYGAGRYMLVLTRPRGAKQPRKSTSYRFILDASYDRMKREADEKAAKALFPVYQGAPPGVPASPSPDAGSMLKESFNMLSSMMTSMFTMLAPLLNRPVETRQIAPPAKDPLDQLGMFTALREVLKTQTKADIDFFSDIKKGFLTMQPATDTETDPETAPAEEKKSIFERILAIAEPFIPLMAQNTAQAKIAAAGFRAIPQVQAAVKDITSNPELLQRVVDYVEKKEGRAGAIIALRNMGIQVAPVARGPENIPTARVVAPRPPAARVPIIRKQVPAKPIQKGGRK